MRKNILRLLGVLAIFAVSISAYNSAEQEEEMWNRCIKIQNKQERKSCIRQFEQNFYSESLYSKDELNWSDIDWRHH